MRPPLQEYPIEHLRGEEALCVYCGRNRVWQEDDCWTCFTNMDYRDITGCEANPQYFIDLLARDGWGDEHTRAALARKWAIDMPFT